ncbi:MAG: transglutaminase family protein [Candidatus Hodarchaeota archaeon]
MKKTSCLLIILIVQMSIISSNKVESSTPDTYMTINQEYTYLQQLNKTTLSIEDNPYHLKLVVNVYGLPKNQDNNITLVLSSNNIPLEVFTNLISYESGVTYYEYSKIGNEGFLEFSAYEDKSRIEFNTYFIPKIPFFDPLEISTKGEFFTHRSQTPTIIMNPLGKVYSTFQLTIISELEELSGRLAIEGTTNVSFSSNAPGFHSEGPFFWLSQVIPGSYFVECDYVLEESAADNQRPRLLITTKSSKQVPLQASCYVNGKFVAIDRLETKNFYERYFDLRETTEPGFYFYSGSSLWQACFSTTPPVTFTIDQSEREKIEYLNLGGKIEDFSIKKEDNFGQSCYQIEFSGNFSQPSEIGLQVMEKEWFLATGQILTNIPTAIVQEYTDPSLAFEGHLIDVDAPIVGKWATEVVGDSSDLLRIAYLLYANLTHSINYDKSIVEIEEQMGHDASASWILENKIGLCGHLARAYAALLMYCGLPARIVLGTAISTEIEAEPIRTSIPNHVWNEIYLPGSGWITVDLVAKQFGILDAYHIVATSWEYSNATFEFNKLNTTTLRERKNQGESSLDDMIQILHTRLEQNPKELDDRTLAKYQSKLTEIESQVDRELYHQALLSLTELAYSLELEKIKPGPDNAIPHLGEALLSILALVFASLYLLERKKRC